jgi:S1-C subfamily serine protease
MMTIRMLALCTAAFTLGQGGIVEAASRSTGTAIIKTSRGELHLRSEAGGGVRVVSSNIGGRDSLQAGDVIVTLADRDVQTPEDIFGALRAAGLRGTATASVLRGAERIALPLRVSEFRNFLPPEPPQPSAHPAR